MSATPGDPDRRPPGVIAGARDADEERCPRCDTRLERADVAGRSTRWCPACQPG